jgi:hypothetical protein
LRVTQYQNVLDLVKTALLLNILDREPGLLVMPAKLLPVLIVLCHNARVVSGPGNYCSHGSCHYCKPGANKRIVHHNQRSHFTQFLPKVRISYPSSLKGQMFIPLVNVILYLGCCFMVFHFRESAGMEAA